MLLTQSLIINSVGLYKHGLAKHVPLLSLFFLIEFKKGG